MKITGEFEIPASRERVWRALNDPTILAQSIPGCEEIEKVSDTEFRARVVVKVGPVKAAFRGKVTLSDLDPPNGYRIAGEGQGGVAGFARGEARVRLTGSNTATLLSYEAEATVGGKLAQVGQRLLGSTARKLAADFFGTFSALVSAAPEEPAPEEQPVTPAETPPAPSSLGPWVWVAGVLVIVAVLLFAFNL
ncbi:MAG: carbon monoxide dehydrogenase subunit G [Alphaproteobacteria bacterium]